jgi:hypothetical protein
MACVMVQVATNQGRSGASLGATCLALVSLTGCDGLRSAADREAMHIVIPDSAVHVVGTSESIAAVQDLEVLTDNTVWVHNSVEPFSIGFPADGALHAVYGRGGGGPGEFGAPSGSSWEALRATRGPSIGSATR